MDLLDRYLHAVRFWLPKQQQDDILSELSEDIRSEIQDREAPLGRSLTEAELSELLKRRGNPMGVAAGYLPQRYLIGPALFPVYLLVLKILAWCYFLPWILVWLGLMIAAPGYRAAHPGWTWLHTWDFFWDSAFFTFGITTAVFAVMERTGAAERWKDGWDPRKLPVRRDPSRIPRGSSIAGIVVGILLLLCWTQLPRVPALEGDGVRIGPGPAWPTVYWMIIGLTAAAVGMSCANLLRPWWTRRRAGLQLALDLAGFVPVALLLGVASWVEVTSTTLSSARVAAISRAINLSVRGAIGVVGIFVLIACVQDLVRIARLRPGRGRGDAQKAGH